MPFYAEEPPSSGSQSERGPLELPGLSGPQPGLAPQEPPEAPKAPTLQEPRASTASSGLTLENEANASGITLTTAGEGELEIATKYFNELCQRRGLSPDYQLEPYRSVGFVGTLDVDGKRIRWDEPERSKKEVKKKLAAQGLKLIQGDASASPKTTTAVNGQAAAEGSPAAENWIGKLQEFLAQSPGHPTPEYTLEGGDQGPFLCTVQFRLKTKDGVQRGKYITERALGKKKDARAEVAKKAILDLVRAGLMTHSGEHSEATVPAAASLKAPSAVLQAPDTGPNPCQKLASFSTKYQMPPPKYDIKALDASRPAFYSGSVYFPCSNLAGRENFETGGPIGRVNNVYGKKNAKEELARLVLPIVEQTMREMLANLDS